jgi:hypothetical protein
MEPQNQMEEVPPSPSFEDIEAWEDEGGATAIPASKAPLTGTVNQVEWAERIKREVQAEFDRVVAAFRAIADKQDGENRASTESVIARLEDKRAEVMKNDWTGYFIHDGQEIGERERSLPGDQVRHLILRDPRYVAIKPMRAVRLKS